MAKSEKDMALENGSSVLTKVINFLNRILMPINRGAVAIAGTSAAIMMCLIFVDVAGRYIFTKPVPGGFEITQFLMAILIIFALGYCALERGHIRVDLIPTYLPGKTGRIIDVFVYGISTIFCAFLTWQSGVNAISYFNNKLVSPVLFIPIYPFVCLLAIGATLITLIFIRDTLESINEALKICRH